MTTMIHGFKSELLIGILNSDSSINREKRVELRKLSGATENCITNEKFGAKHPMQWSGRVLATMVDRIGDEEVFEPFRKSKYRKLPKPILRLPLADLDVLMLLTHLYTYGPELQMGDVDCPSCKRTNRDVEVDLSMLQFREARVPDIEAFTARLVMGFVKEGNPQDPTFKSYMNQPWNRYIFRPPTLGDAIRHEGHYVPNKPLPFQMRIYNDCLIGVESWDNEGGDDYKVAEMDQADREMEGMDLFDLDGRDRGLIRGAFTRLPGIDLSTEEECEHCGEMMPVAVDPTRFHPLVDGD